MIHIAIMKPFDPAHDAFQLEAQTFWNGPAANVLRRTLDGDAIEFPRIEGVSNHRPAAGCHNALSLMRRVEPIKQGRPAV